METVLSLVDDLNSFLQLISPTHREQVFHLSNKSKTTNTKQCVCLRPAVSMDSSLISKHAAQYSDWHQVGRDRLFSDDTTAHRSLVLVCIEVS
jgi:hypothetical protein